MRRPCSGSTTSSLACCPWRKGGSCCCRRQRKRQARAATDRVRSFEDRASPAHRSYVSARPSRTRVARAIVPLRAKLHRRHGDRLPRAMCGVPRDRKSSLLWEGPGSPNPALRPSAPTPRLRGACASGVRDDVPPPGCLEKRPSKGLASQRRLGRWRCARYPPPSPSGSERPRRGRQGLCLAE